MIVRTGLALLGLYNLANGLAMLLWPTAWAAAAVHLARPDHLHRHFIADIAMAYLLSGAGLLMGSRRGGRSWAIAGAAWPALHGLLHVREWIFDGPPAATGDLVKEGLGVILVGAAGAVLAGLRRNKGET